MLSPAILIRALLVLSVWNLGQAVICVGQDPDSLLQHKRPSFFELEPFVPARNFAFSSGPMPALESEIERLNLSQNVFTVGELKLLGRFHDADLDAESQPDSASPLSPLTPQRDGLSPNEFGSPLADVSDQPLLPNRDFQNIKLTSYRAPDHSAFGGLAFIAVAPHLRQELEGQELADEVSEEDVENEDGNQGSVFSLSAKDLSKVVLARKRELLEIESDDNEHLESLKLLSLAEEALLKFDSDQSLKRKFETESQQFGFKVDILREQLNNVAQAQVPLTALPEGIGSLEEEHAAVIALLSKLQPELQDRQTRLQDLKSVLESIKDQIQVRSDRVTAIPSERAAAVERREDVRAQLQELQQEWTQEDIGNELQLRLWLSRAKTLQANIEVEKLDAELQWQEPAGKKLPLERDLKTREIKALESEIESWEKAVASTRRREVDLQSEIASEAAVNAKPQLRELAQYNKHLTKQRTLVNQRVEFWRGELSKANEQFDQVDQRLKNLKAEIKEGEITAINGLLLKDSRQSMIQPGESFNQIHMARNELRTVNASLLELRHERERLADPFEFVQATLGIDPEDESDVETNQLTNLALGFVEDRVKYLDNLLNDYDLYRGELKRVKVKRGELVEKIATLGTYIDEKALWIRSADPIALADLKQSSLAIQTIFSTEEWAPLIHGVKKRVLSKPYESGLGVMGLFALFVFSRRFKEKVRR